MRHLHGSGKPRGKCVSPGQRNRNINPIMMKSKQEQEKHTRPGDFRPIIISLAAVLIGIVLVIAFHAVPFRGLILFLLAFVAFVLPGLALGKVLLPFSSKNPTGFFFSCAVGLALSSLIGVVLAYCFGWRPLLLLIILVAASIIALVIQRKRRSPLHANGNLSPWQSREFAALLVFLIIAASFLILPFRNVGAKIGDEYRYAWLFGHDFINRGALSTSISHGVPPAHMYFSGAALRYYYLAYILPAFVYSVSKETVPIFGLMQMTCLAYSLLLVCIIFSFFRSLVRKTAAFISVMALALIAYSYMGLFVFGRCILQKVLSLPYPVTHPPVNWKETLMSFTPFSHTFYRFFLVEPQAVLGICLMLVIIHLTISKPLRTRSIFVSSLLGILIGLELGAEAMTAAVLVAWFSIVGLLDIVKLKGRRGPMFASMVVSGAGAVAIFLPLLAIGMFSTKSGSTNIQFALHKVFLLGGPLYLLLDYGPMSIFGILGLVACARSKGDRDGLSGGFGILLWVSLFMILFVRNPVEADFGLLKGARILPIPLLLFSGCFFENLRRRTSLAAFAWMIAIAAIPTLFTDLRTASNVRDPYHTTYVRKADYEACRWIKRNTPTDAIIQSNPNYPAADVRAFKGNYNFSLISIFAERPMAAGDWKLTQLQHDFPHKARARYNDIIRMFQTADLQEAVRIIRDCDVDYIYIGQLEKRLYPEGAKKFHNHSRLFRNVYSRNGVNVYQVVRPQGIDPGGTPVGQISP